MRIYAERIKKFFLYILLLFSWNTWNTSVSIEAHSGVCVFQHSKIHLEHIGTH